MVNNGRFPRDLLIEFVLSEFFDAILQKKVQIKGFNLLAHMTAFHEWLDNYEHQLRGKWWLVQHPEGRPKAIPASASVSEKEQQQSDQERAKMLKQMFGADDVPESLQKFVTE